MSKTDPKYVPPAKIKYDPVARRKEMPDYPLVELRESTRIECARCHMELPISMYIRGTDPLCRTCRKKTDDEQRTVRENQDLQEASQQLISSANGTGKQLDRLENFLAEMMVNAGGYRQFCARWWKHFEIAMERRPGSHGVLQHFQSIAKLVMDVNKLQHQESVLDLSDQQLQHKKEMAMLSLLTEAAGDPGKRKMLMGVLRATGADVETVPGVSEQDSEHSKEDDADASSQE